MAPSPRWRSPKGVRLVGWCTSAAPHRFGVWTPAEANFRPWIKKNSLAVLAARLGPPGYGPGFGGFVGWEKPGYFLLMKNGGVRSPGQVFFKKSYVMILLSWVFFPLPVYMRHPAAYFPLGKQTNGAKEPKNYDKQISLINQLIVTHHLIRSLMAAGNYKSQTSSCDGNTTPHTPSPQVPNPSHLHRCWASSSLIKMPPC